jgi:hypothetical protein
MVSLRSPFAKLNHWSLLLFGVLLQSRDERLADRIHERAGGKSMTPV